jgi:hypothetical protein
MPNQVRANRGTNNGTVSNSAFAAAIKGLSAGSIMTALMDGAIGYGEGSPLYDLVQFVGMPSRVVNTLDTPFETHAQLTAALKPGEGGISVSVFGGRDVYTLGVKAPTGAVYYFSLYHDKDGNPQVDGQLYLAKVEVVRDFSIKGVNDDQPLLKKGAIIFKAVPQAYAEKLSERAEAKAA